MRLVAMVSMLVACGSGKPKLFPAGAQEDDGHGELARASARFMTSEEGDDLFAASARKPRAGTGGSSDGGATYGGFAVPQWTYPTVNRTPKYAQVTGLSGSVEGVVSWRGPAPAKRTTTCGAIESVRIGPERGVADVLVYIERVKTGRTLPIEGRPATVGGIVVKRGCAFVPTVQIVTPLPAALAIHGDGRPTKLRVTTPPSVGKSFELQAGGRVAMQASPGITRIDAEDGALASAWVHALDTPYYALTDDRGRYRIDELAPGTYELTFWQAPIAEAGIGSVKYREPTVVRRTVKVETARSTRLDVALGR